MTIYDLLEYLMDGTSIKIFDTNIEEDVASFEDKDAMDESDYLDWTLDSFECDKNRIVINAHN